MEAASRILLAAALAFSLPAAMKSANAADTLPPNLPSIEDPRLIQVATSQHIWNGVAVSADGRILVSLTQSEGPGISLAELRNGELHPFSDEAWNHRQPNTGPARHLLHVKLYALAQTARCGRWTWATRAPAQANWCASTSPQTRFPASTHLTAQPRKIATSMAPSPIDHR
ncbi:hypothetical protein [Paraburkholderia bannensis]|uniref:hypothetical protein n=1 Tax=Paraburkholderia bannensis TaxID=765414 RepID=UPI002ABE74D8|nr:hypothetical protein [Paraburkholderia bannensis]